MKNGQMALIWIGASISISEIVTGTFIGGLAFGKALFAIIVGHLAGALFIGAAGYISWKQQKNAMEAAAGTFGKYSGKCLAFCNAVQLIGWTVIMVVQAANTITGLFSEIPINMIILILALLTAAWTLLFKTPAGILNSISVILLGCLCIMLFFESIINKNITAIRETIQIHNSMTFIAAFELSLSMPISWLPLVGDYSRDAKSKAGASFIPGAAYFMGSSLMYFLGFCIAGTTGSGFFAFLSGSRFSIIACAVVVLSTLTTAFLDLYSASVSVKSIINLKSERIPLLCLSITVIILSLFFPVAQFESVLENFLYIIGSVFVPVYTIIILNYFFASHFSFQWKNILILCAVCGIAAYHIINQCGWGAAVIASITIPCLIYIILYRMQIYISRKKNCDSKYL